MINGLVDNQKALNKLDYEVEVEIGFGDPSSEIISIVSAKDVDLLILGAHGHKGLKDLVFGTTVDKVRHGLKIHILIVN